MRSASRAAVMFDFLSRLLLRFTWQGSKDEFLFLLLLVEYMLHARFRVILPRIAKLEAGLPQLLLTRRHIQFCLLLPQPLDVVAAARARARDRHAWRRQARVSSGPARFATGLRGRT